MTKIGLIADTHGWLDQQILQHFSQCDEIWHAGDFGNISIAERLAGKQLDESSPNQSSLTLAKRIRGVYGNIDGPDVRSVYPEKLHFTCEKVRVFMTHIGGHPAKYAMGIKEEIQTNKSGLFICGHSHILKIMFDDKLNCLHINPGAAGRQGWHQVRTIVRLVIDGDIMKDCEVIELGKR
jgi:putative phosphoesterase